MEGLETQPVLTDYEKAEFFGRLEWFIEATDGYDGTLPEIWENAQRLKPSSSEEIIPTDAEVLTPNHEHEIGELIDKISNAGLASVVIEAAHVYLYQDIEEPNLRESILTQCFHASALTAKLSEAGIDTSQVLFVDDYNPDPSNGQKEQETEIESLVGLVRSEGYNPAVVLYEGNLVPMAKRIVEFMHEHQGAVKMPASFNEGMDLEDLVATNTDEGDNVELERRNIQLYRPYEDMVSCSMLDTALTILKLKYIGEGVVNVLPGGSQSQQGFSYGGQQEKMRQILYEHLGVRKMPVYNLFTGNTREEDIAAGAHNHFRKPRVAA